MIHSHTSHARGLLSRRTAILSGLLAGLLACGGQSSARASSDAPTSTGSRVITRETIAKWNVLDAYAVVERAGGYRVAAGSGGGVSVRQRRGQSSVTNANADRPVLVVDGTQMSDFDMLRRIRANEIERVEFLSPTDATQKYGTNSNGAGAIIVVTRSRP